MNPVVQCYTLNYIISHNHHGKVNNKHNRDGPNHLIWSGIDSANFIARSA